MKIYNGHINRSHKSSFKILLFCVLNIIAGNTIVAQQYSAANEPLLSETVWLTTDRSLYLPGDEVKFSALIMETDTYYRSGISKILRVELIDNTGKQVEQKEFYVDNSRVDNNINVPSTTHSGWYYLRAYTNWMRNSTEGINNYLPLKIIDPGDISPHRTPPDNKRITANITPENKSLILNKVNNCAIRLISSSDYPISTEGCLLTSSNDTIIRFVTGPSGWSNFSFVPRNDESYRIYLPGFPDSEIHTLIPEGQSNDLYCTYDGNDESIKLSIENCASPKLKLLVHRYNTWYDYQIADTDNGRLSFNIDSRDFPNGIFQLTLFDDQNAQLYSRLYIKNPLYPENIIISLDPSPDNEGSLSVKFNKGISHTHDNALFNSIVSTEEPGGSGNMYIPGLPGWHFSFEIPVEKDGQEGWLIANSYPAAVAESFFDSTVDGPINISTNPEISTRIRESSVEYLPETRGFVISGRVTDSIGDPVEGKIISATLLSDNSFYANYTFPSGKFYMVIAEHKKTEDIIVSFASKPLSDWTLEIDNRFETRTPNLPEKAFYISDEEVKYIGDLDIRQQLVSIYKEIENDTSKTISSEQLLPASFIRNPDKITFVDDFIKLNNIREVIYEVVPYVSIRKEKNIFYLNIIGDPPISALYPPLFLLDAIPIFDFSEFLDLPVDRLFEIRQLNKITIHGNAIFGGIVSFQTVNNDLGGLKLPDKSILLTIDMPVYENTGLISQPASKDVGRPRLNNTLYSDSFNNLLSDFKIYPNDNLGKYSVRISGFNRSGQWMFAEKSLILGKEGFILNDRKE